MNTFKVIAFTHKNLPLELIGKLHLSNERQKETLGAFKIHFRLEEFLFLSTCNRIELFIRNQGAPSLSLVREMALFLNSDLNHDEALKLSQSAEVHEGQMAVTHVLKVASSLESLVIGEREIITQVRKAYEFCSELNLTGDFIRLLIKQTIETAKDIYTNTNIAKNPVSVASLAYRQLRELGIKNEARILFVGSGETNTIFANYLQKHKFANFTVFNRTLQNARKLAAVLNGTAHELAGLKTYDKGFDVLIVCTSSSETIITSVLFKQLLANENSKKVIVDLSLPSNVEATVSQNKQVHYIDINSIRTQAEANLQLRKNEIVKCEEIISQRVNLFNSIYAERKVELAFGEVPKKVKAIKHLAMNEVFAKEIDAMDDQSKELLEKVMSYMEKKYNAVAIKTAKDVLLGSKN